MHQTKRAEKSLVKMQSKVNSTKWSNAPIDNKSQRAGFPRVSEYASAGSPGLPSKIWRGLAPRSVGIERSLCDFRL